MEDAKILVTGTTVFIGRHLVHRLLKEGGDVRALARSNQYIFEMPGLSWTYGDLTDTESLVSTTQGVSVVYHTASLVPGSGGHAEIWRINVLGGKNLVDACIRCCVRRFCFCEFCSRVRASSAHLSEGKCALGRD